MEIIIDTNVFVAVFSEQDPLHERAIKVMEECPKPFIVHEYVLLETVSVLMRKVGKQTADLFLQNTLTNSDSRILYSTPPLLFLSGHTFLSIKNKQLSFVDAALLGLSARYSIVTFDENLKKAIKKLNAVKN